MGLVPLGVIFAGYQITYYGFALLKGPGMGFLDLLLPQRWGKADGIIQGWNKGGGSEVQHASFDVGGGDSSQPSTSDWLRPGAVSTTS